MGIQRIRERGGQIGTQVAWFCCFFIGVFGEVSGVYGQQREQNLKGEEEFKRSEEGKSDIKVPSKEIPPSLEEWASWALWDHEEFANPRAYHNQQKAPQVWLSRCVMKVNEREGTFQVRMKVFTPSWFELPGGGQEELWPQQVKLGGKVLPVAFRNGKPAVYLSSGEHELSGRFEWMEMPQKISLPRSIGVLDLQVKGQPIYFPEWHQDGTLWFKKTKGVIENQRNQIQTNVYRLLEDGLPLWLHTEVEMSVSGKSREEQLGFILPEGWFLSEVNSPLPCTIDPEGRMKVQVRPGRWKIQLKAFYYEKLESFAYLKGQKSVAPEELIAFRANPKLRLVEIEGGIAVDASQTLFPQQWRRLPVYRWKTKEPLVLKEQMRGMGYKKPSGLRLSKQIWLDEGGKEAIFYDRLQGRSQQVWRLDATKESRLGAVRQRGEGLLITQNPETKENGVELRDQALDLEAVGTFESPTSFSATGWKTDVESCESTLHLPPGWRLFALSGAEYVRGDWLTAWTLLDLFLLLILSMSVFKVWGVVPAIVALLGFGLSFHEPQAPRYLWFVLLVPAVVLKQSLPKGVRTVVAGLKYGAAAILLVYLVSFFQQQVQGVFYPQLEKVNNPDGSSPRQGAIELLGDQLVTKESAILREETEDFGDPFAAPSSSSSAGLSKKGYSFSKLKRKGPKRDRQQVVQMKNLRQDEQARIQTGPAIPNWSWRKVQFGWKSPISSQDQVRVWLIAPWLQKIITLLSTSLLVYLFYILVKGNLAQDMKKPWSIGARSKVNKGLSACLILSTFGMSLEPLSARNYPSEQLIKTLEKRLVELKEEPLKGLSQFAEISEAHVLIKGQSLHVNGRVHVHTQCALPLPGQLPSWSPIRILVNGHPAKALARHEGYLWIALPKGIHQVELEGVLPQATEWTWSFLLKPRRVTVEASGWDFTGLKATGVPEKHLVFKKKTPAVEREKNEYAQQDLSSAILVSRNLEIGNVWKVRTTVTRLSSSGKAISLAVPLLEGERVISADQTIQKGRLELQLGASEHSFTWESELSPVDSLVLQAPSGGIWTERWSLVASPIWNLSFKGLDPIYEVNASALHPVWAPWPGEKLVIEASKPVPLQGETMTIHSVTHHQTLSARQRQSELKVQLQASIGQDLTFEVQTQSEKTEFSELKVKNKRYPNGQSQPLRRQGDQITVPIQPGDQEVILKWVDRDPISFLEKSENIRFPIASSNMTHVSVLPENRWVLWAKGPLQGPAIRLWSILASLVVISFFLGRVSGSPLKMYQWFFLLTGLTQVHLLAAFFVVGWFFFLMWRGKERVGSLPIPLFNGIQILLVLASVVVVLILITALRQGFLGTPEMMIQGYRTYGNELQWYASLSSGALPKVGVYSVSIWYYRFLMLVWALWLAFAMMRWAPWGWNQWIMHGMWKKQVKRIVPPSAPPNGVAKETPKTKKPV